MPCVCCLTVPLVFTWPKAGDGLDVTAASAAAWETAASEVDSSS